MKYRFKNVITDVIVDIKASDLNSAKLNLKAEYGNDDYENFRYLEMIDSEAILGKKKKWKKWTKFLLIILGIWIIGGTIYNTVNNMIIQASLERDNYDPLVIDEEACRELVKVENSLNAFFKDYTYDEALDEYLYGSFLPDAESEAIKRIKGAKGVRFYDNERSWYNSFEQCFCRLTFKEAKEWYSIFNKHKEWYKNLRPKLEYYLYSKCNSGILWKNSSPGKYDVVEIRDKSIYDRAAEEKILQYFNNLNAPSIDYSELINDDNANYQVWEISKESDPDRESDTKITVSYDSENRRTRMRLFHPKK